mmetsp:Transcript_89129/g.260550  ORF Transcript_89129/g.260550 Transcript_89129/m.260550 type:complete len:406 (-) Transcript_89129:179-1396(-)
MAGDSGSIAGSIACVVVSSMTTTFGLFFQKMAMERSTAYVLCFEQIPNPTRYVLKTRMIWFAGFLCITLFSFFLDMYSFATLGQAMVVPLLASLEVAENQVFAPCVLGEHFDKFYDIPAAWCCILGALFTTLFGPGGPLGGAMVQQTLTELSYSDNKAHFGELFSAPFFLCFEVVTVALFVASLVLSRVHRCKRMHFLMMGYMAGFLGGQQNMFLKGVATLLEIVISGDTSVFGDWPVYVFVVGMASLASAQLYFLNLGLARFEALRFVPAYTILYITMSTLVGLVFYQEYRLISALGWGMFGVGFVFIGTATTILGLKPPPPAKIAVLDEGKDEQAAGRQCSKTSTASRGSSVVALEVRNSDSGRRAAGATAPAPPRAGDLLRKHVSDGRAAPVCDAASIQDLS